MPNVGEKAPDFNALDQDRNRVVLSSAVKKSKVLLAFYPADKTPVCTAQLCDYRDNLEQFKKLNVQIFGISISNHESQASFAKENEFSFPLLNDYDTRITKRYGVMSIAGTPKRAIFLIDENQKIVYKHVEFLPITRRTSEELVEEIKKLFPETASKTKSTAESSEAKEATHSAE